MRKSRFAIRSRSLTTEFVKRKVAFSLVEIILGLFFLAIAVIPVAGLIGSAMGDTEVSAGFQFAQKNARTIMDYLLDEVPFVAIVPAAKSVPDLDGTNPKENTAEIVATPKFTPINFLKLFGNIGKDNYARGTLKSERGLEYKIRLYVFPVQSASSTDGAGFCLSCIPRPPFENSHDQKGLTNWFSTDEYVREGVLRPYDYQVATTVKMVSELGVEKGSLNAFPYCVLKKVFLKISWKMKGRDQSIDFLSIKADI
ncbi:MAG: hypothetical protein HQM08_15310 [Candidatus Riflebacteria bacterium]|nr:hypothetical protein [Candidatus Riflebacteria bacterium]